MSLYVFSYNTTGGGVVAIGFSESFETTKQIADFDSQQFFLTKEFKVRYQLYFLIPFKPGITRVLSYSGKIII